MRRNKHSSPLRRFFVSRLFLLLSLIVIGFVAMSYARAYYQDYTIRKEIIALQEEVKDLQKKRLESMEILEYVRGDAFVEEKARTDLNMKKPGEQVIFLKNIAASLQTDENTIVQSGQDLSNPLKWWYYFIHAPLSSAEE